VESGAPTRRGAGGKGEDLSEFGDEQIAAARAVIAAASPEPMQLNRCDGVYMSISRRGESAWATALVRAECQESDGHEHNAFIRMPKTLAAFFVAAAEPETGWGATLTALEEVKRDLDDVAADVQDYAHRAREAVARAEAAEKMLGDARREAESNRISTWAEALRAEAAEAALAEARATNTRLNRRAQKAERRVARWEYSPNRTLRAASRWNRAVEGRRRYWLDHAEAAEAECERLRAGIRKAIDQAYGCGHSGHRGTDEPKAFYETLHALVGTANELETPAE
jgi:hypothetical protein